MILVKYIFFPLSLLYRYFFNKKKDNTTPIRLPARKIWSVGNLSVGGTGKTPFTLAILDAMQKISANADKVVLSRGYGGKLSPWGAKVELDSVGKEVGDEPLLIKKRCPHVSVLIGKDRIQSYNRFYASPDSVSNKDYKSSVSFKETGGDIGDSSNNNELIVLDDGFQHFPIARDLDFVLVDSGKGIGDGFTIPLGFLREPVSALERAHVLVITRFNKENLSEKSWNKINQWEEDIRKRFPHLKIFHTYEKVTDILVYKNGNWKKIEPENFSKQSFFAFCGLGNPQAFYRLLENFGILPFARKSFPDHYAYDQKDIEFLGKRKEDYLLCTEKDIVKFSSTSLESLEGRIAYVRMDSVICEDDWLDFIKTEWEKSP